MRILRLKTAGDDVLKWQEFLSEQGFDPGSSDGHFGKKTEEATIAFQSANGLEADGIAANQSFAKAIALGFKLLPDVDAKKPSDKVTEIGSVGGVKIFKLTSGEAVFCTTRMHVDADGSPRAYKADNTGIENIGNAKKKDGSLSPDVIVFSGGKPHTQGDDDPAPGFLVSQTSLRDPNKAATDPAKYVDALKVPYIVLPGGKLGAARVGDVALVIDFDSGSRVKAVVADAGPAGETGEASIFCAGLAIGMKSSEITEGEARKKGSFINPRSGGTDKKRFRYIIFPGTKITWPKSNEEIAARVDGALAALTPDQILTITS
jgi:peptidoglycan hydrolase-like protein with peptidoglycan-binding domain